VTVALVAGFVLGAAAWLVASGLWPVPTPLGGALARLDGRAFEPRTGDEPVDRDARVGGFLLQRVPPLARAVERCRADLRVVGRSAEEQAVRVCGYALLPLPVGPWLAFLAWEAGVRLPWPIPLALAVGGAAWGLTVPFVGLRRAATERRQAFGYALSAWCDVVVMSLAAGRGVEQAMETAALAGEGWVFSELRGALQAGYVRGEPPWEALALLGSELGISDLSELAGTIAMAGEEGAAVRATVAAKARTIRDRLGADMEAAAASATEKMTLPSVLMVAGFLLFMGYPAVAILLQIGD
jgi:Flp pilus assembly protein TadB